MTDEVGRVLEEVTEAVRGEVVREVDQWQNTIQSTLTTLSDRLSELTNEVKRLAGPEPETDRAVTMIEPGPEPEPEPEPERPRFNPF